MLNYSEKYLTSRTYSRPEREHPWFKMINSAILVKDPFRPWEVPAVLATSGIDPTKRYLSVGAWHCSATYIIGQVAEIHALDVNASVTDWLDNEFGLHWSPKVTVKVPPKKGILPYPDKYFDIVISVSAIEHGEKEEDIDTARECGRVLRKGGRFIFTTEFGPAFMNYDSVIGGRIYNETQLMDRLIKPSGCRLVGPYPDDYVQMLTFKQPDYEDIKRVELPQMQEPFCPAIIILRK